MHHWKYVVPRQDTTDSVLTKYECSTDVAVFSIYSPTMKMKEQQEQRGSCCCRCQDTLPWRCELDQLGSLSYYVLRPLGHPLLRHCVSVDGGCTSSCCVEGRGGRYNDNPVSGQGTPMPMIC